MNIHSPSATQLAKRGFNTAITAASNNGAGVDCQGFERALAIFDSVPSGAGTTSDCKLQESSDNSSFSDVTSAAFAQATTVGGAKIQVMDINLSKRLRYLRLVHTGAGASAAGVAFGAIILENPRYSPVSQDNTVVSV
jgi:hypothetical protein